SGALFRVVRRLQARGVGVLYVSHRLEEIFALADCVSVLRDGRHVATCPIRDIDRGGLIRLMIGRELGSTPPAGSVAARPGLCTAAQRKQPAIAAEHAGLRVERLARRGAFDDVSLDVRPGEIVGLAGLVGAGRSELARAIFGIDRYDRGRVLADGKELRPGSVRAALATGVALAPEDRQVAGLVLPMSVRANLTLAVLRTVSRLGLLSRRRERRLATELQGDLLIRAAGLGAPAWSLSGGNQQKLLLGKWLATRPRVLILDEPTRGVDVGAKAEIHALIRRLAGEGMATLLISSELPEVLLLSDRVLVMRAGRIVGELLGAEATQEQVLALALPDEPAQTTDIQARDI
ncbi:MAG: sugar ABC transporter ATP-binding protein, partial [Planctomycetota bacterium]